MGCAWIDFKDRWLYLGLNIRLFRTSLNWLISTLTNSKPVRAISHQLPKKYQNLMCCTCWVGNGPNLGLNSSTRSNKPNLF